MTKFFMKGVGFTEILVSLLLLSLIVFGFLGLQKKSMMVTQSASSRLYATQLTNNLTEMIKRNSDASLVYRDILQGTTKNIRATNRNCYTEFCTSENQAIFDVGEVKKDAKNKGISLGVQLCNPSEKTGKKCIYAVWGNTTLDACMKTLESNERYKKSINCTVMEAFND